MRQSMSNHSPTYLFMDANIALHFSRPDQVDWFATTHSRNAILVATPIFLRELDQKKFEGKSAKLRERARKYIKWLLAFSRDPAKEVRPGVRWKFLRQEPNIDWASLGLDQNISDDQLIASVIQFAHNQRIDAFVVTEDIGLEVKLTARKIGVLSLSDDFRLPDEHDKLEGENAALRSRLQNSAGFGTAQELQG